MSCARRLAIQRRWPGGRTYLPVISHLPGSRAAFFGQGRTLPRSGVPSMGTTRIWSRASIARTFSACGDIIVGRPTQGHKCVDVSAKSSGTLPFAFSRA